MKSSQPLPPLTACLCAALCTFSLSRPGQGEEVGPPGQDVARLVRDLGSTNFQVREAAARRLLDCEEPPAALRAAVKSSDPEVVRRAARIINEITRREENAAYSKLTEFARRGEIDRLVELLVRRLKWGDEDACWQVVTELSGKLFDLDKKTYRRTSFPSPAGLPVSDFRRYVQLSHPQRVAGRRVALKPGRFVVRAEHIASGRSIASASLLASSRSTRVQGEFTLGLVLAGGPVEVESMVCSIVVCAGGCKARRDVRGCLIIARGDVEFSGDVAGCHIITSGSVNFAPGKLRYKNEVQENEPNPLGFVKWFDPARVGVTVEAAEGGVRVRAAGKSFAAAGLRAGDLLTALDGEAVKSPDEFRLLLRAKLADGGRMALTVRRAGRDLTIPVRCKD